MNDHTTEKNAANRNLNVHVSPFQHLKMIQISRNQAGLKLFLTPGKLKKSKNFVQESKTMTFTLYAKKPPVQIYMNATRTAQLVL